MCIILFLILCITVAVINNSHGKHGHSVVVASPITVPLITDTRAQQPSPTETPQPETPLSGIIETALEGTHGTYGIAVKNFRTFESYTQNGHHIFETGSLYKLWVMAVTYEQIQAGQLTEDDILSEDAAVLNQKFSIDPELAEQTEGTVTYTVRDALTRMITISHNYAALLLTAKIRLAAVEAFLKQYGLSESKVGINGAPPVSTPSDIALFFEKLYRGELANQQYTEEMTGLLKNQRLTGGIPKYLPESAVVANKTGELDSFKHDAGIVYTDAGDYIIVVMSDSDDPPAAQDRIARVSKAVYDYFTGSTDPEF